MSERMSLGSAAHNIFNNYSVKTDSGQDCHSRFSPLQKKILQIQNNVATT